MPEGSRSAKSLDLPTIAARFGLFVEALESIYGVVLPRPTISCPKKLSEFCSGLVEGDSSHLWRPAIRGLGAKSRFGLAHSLFLFRKVIPKEKPAVDSFLKKMSTPQEAPDTEFLSFALRETRRLFPIGWDRSYFRRSQHAFVPETACSELSRSAGGSKGVWGFSDSDRAEFCLSVLSHYSTLSRPASVVQAIETGGKWRILAIPPCDDNRLRPFHHAMYDHLSRYKWLLRGDAKPERFKDFTRKEGEVFVSGDYESATDNLNSEVMKQLLSVVYAQSSNVPLDVFEHAISTYSSSMQAGRSSRPSSVYVQRRGQMMGQLTSFPLLCLINYITFRYSFRHRVRKGLPLPPVRINGDDIVFRAMPSEFSQWASDVSKGGLTLSAGKTLVHSRGFTLNSTPFWSSFDKVVAGGFVRSSAIWKDAELPEQVYSLNSRYYSCCAGYGGDRRTVVRSLFLKVNSPAVFSSRRSVTRGLGIKCGESSLRSAGLWHRELYYLQQPAEVPLPAPSNERVEGWTRSPKYKYTSSEIAGWASAHSAALLDKAWGECNSDDINMEMSVIRSGTFPYGLPYGHKYRRMLGMTRSQAWKWAESKRDPSYFGRSMFKKKGDEIWVMTDCLYASKRIQCPRFISDGGSWAGRELSWKNPAVERLNTSPVSVIGRLKRWLRLPSL